MHIEGANFSEMMNVTHWEIPIGLLIYTITHYAIVIIFLPLLSGCFESKGMEKDLAKMPQITKLAQL